MTDFELAAINAFKNKFPNINNKGCLFHFAQSLYKKFVSLGFSTDYAENSNVNVWFRKLFCMSVIPIENIDDEFKNLVNSTPSFPEEVKNRKLNDFVDYFVNTYFEGSYPISLWNHFETEGPRTNNSLEAYNNKLKLHIGVAHPNIYKSIEFFQKQETVSYLKYQNAIANKPPPRRKKLDIGKDNELHIYKKMLREGDINLTGYLRHILHLFSFRLNKSSSKKPDQPDSDSSESEDDLNVGEESVEEDI